MADPAGQAARAARTNLLHALAVLAICLGVFAVYLTFSGIGSNPRAALPDLLDGAAHKPFQYRLLVPALLNLAAPLLPARLELPGALASLTAIVNQLAASDPSRAAAALLTLALMFAALLGSVYALGRLMLRLGYPLRLARWLTLLYPLTLVVFFLAAYLYDFPNLFLFSCALLLLAPSPSGAPHTARHWLLYLLIFGLATLNKETSIILLIPFALLYFPRLERTRFALLSLAQLGVYALIKLALYVRFAPNPGGMVEVHWQDHLRLFQNLPVFMLLTAALVVILIVLPVAAGWRQKPRFLRQALWMVVPLLPLYFLFGVPFEVRVFMEVYPVIFLLLIPPRFAPEPGSSPG